MTVMSNGYDTSSFDRLALDSLNLDGQPRASTSSSAGRSLDLPSLQPLSHDHPLLSAPSDQWDADTFLLSRLHIPLEELRGELRSYLGGLREELTLLINEDYEEFISLGTGLRGEEERLRSLEKPLEGVRLQVENVRDVLANHQAEVQSKLDERAALREEKALLDLLQRLFETLSRAETLLDHPAHSKTSDINATIDISSVPALLGPGFGNGDEGDVEKHKLVIRVAGEYTQLVYLLNKARAEGCAVVDAVGERIDKIKRRISRDLATLLTAEIDDPDIPRLKQCLKTYELIEGWDEAEEVVRRSVREFCKDTITPVALAPVTSPTVPDTPHPLANPFDKSFRLPIPPNNPSAPTALITLYNRILAQVEGYQPLLQISEDISDQYDFFSRVIWSEISDAIVDRLGAVVFAAGRPDELHRHYTTTHAFIGILENIAPSPKSVLAMRNSSSFAAFERRWQLPVYFQLRWKEIVGAVETALSPSAGPPTMTMTGNEWALGQSAAIWKALETCWSDEVYIPELASRFWRLTLQIVARYSTYLRNIMDTYTINEDDATSISTSTSTSSQQSPEDAALRFAACAILDLDNLSKRTGELEIVKSLGLREHVNISVNHYSEKILIILIKKCIDPLKLIRSIASQFRSSPSSTPTNSSGTIASTTTSSYFIPTVFKPLHHLLDSRPPSLKEKYGVEWSTEISENVFVNYNSILTSVRKTEDLLRRHRKSKKSGFSSFFSSSSSSTTTNQGGEAGIGGGEEKEEERFKNQVLVDIQYLKKDAESLGVDVEGMTSWKELLEVVNKPTE